MTQGKQYIAMAVVVVSALAAAWMLNVSSLAWKGRPVVSRQRLSEIDPANTGMNVSVTQPWLHSNVLVFNVDKPLPDRDYNRFDVMRCLLQSAQELQDRDFDRIYLANDGKRVYYITADDFKALGRDYNRDSDWNTLGLYTRLPQCTRTLNDSAAFYPNTGLLAGVANASDWNSMMGNLMK